MKIQRYRRNVTAASRYDIPSIGTTFYEIKLHDLKDAYKKDNPLIYEYLVDKGFDCINIRDIYGSRIIGNTLYLCVTDGREIEMSDGQEADPENILDDYGIDEIKDLIQDPPNDKFIRSKISTYEIDTKDLKKDIDTYAESALKVASFKDLVDAYNEIFI